MCLMLSDTHIVPNSMRHPVALEPQGSLMTVFRKAAAATSISSSRETTGRHGRHTVRCYHKLNVYPQWLSKASGCLVMSENVLNNTAHPVALTQRILEASLSKALGPGPAAAVFVFINSETSKSTRAPQQTPQPGSKASACFTSTRVQGNKLSAHPTHKPIVLCAK